MSYAALRTRVEAAERALDARMSYAESRWEHLKRVVRVSMTPGRLLGTGFLTGVLVGFTEPLAKLGGGTKLVQFASSLIALIGAVEAKAAAEEATDAADTATEVTVAADPAAAEAVTAENLQHRVVP